MSAVDEGGAGDVRRRSVHESWAMMNAAVDTRMNPIDYVIFSSRTTTHDTL